jgi:hypothetical protein
VRDVRDGRRGEGRVMDYRIPTHCDHCGRLFDAKDTRRRLALLEDGIALCSECVWDADHLGEGRSRERRAA